jgi:CRISPR-associated protein Cas1
MTNRILDFSETPVFLHASNGLLVIKPQEAAEQTVPFTDIAAVVASHPQVTITEYALSELAKAGGIFICCDGKRLPAAMLLPLQANSLQTERFALQAQAPSPVRKRAWQTIVQSKIRSQAAVLRLLHGEDAGLTAMAARVRSGDAGNLEAQASVRYWRLLFGAPAFRRGDEADPRNDLLNYGYAVIRAIVARAICGAGLHPSFGLHHHNRYDTFCLADDLMEPFRPLIDLAAVRWSTDNPEDIAVHKRSKVVLLATATARYRIGDGSSRTVFDVTTGVAASLCRVLAGEERSLTIPEFTLSD